MNEKIDFVVTWLDSNDPVWQKDFMSYSAQAGRGNISPARFRDWGFFKYWFRAVENYAPWVNKVFLVTNGKFPDWINKKHEKLVLVSHSDYIPKQYLPTFNSNEIIINLNKIKGLSEHFVYFDDDCYLNAPTLPETYFKEGLPCDNNSETLFNVPTYTKEGKFSLYSVIMADIGIINAHFNRWKVINSDRRKWWGPHLTWRQKMIHLLMGRKPFFVGFNWPHFEQPFLKSVWDEVWEKEEDLLFESCTKFREEAQNNQYVFRYWQFATNRFYPTKYGHQKYFNLKTKNLEDIKKALNDKSIFSLCINDSISMPQEEFYKIQETIINLFEKKFPDKSSFEK